MSLSFSFFLSSRFPHCVQRSLCLSRDLCEYKTPCPPFTPSLSLQVYLFPLLFFSFRFGGAPHKPVKLNHGLTSGATHTHFASDNGYPQPTLSGHIGHTRQPRYDSFSLQPKHASTQARKHGTPTYFIRVIRNPGSYIKGSWNFPDRQRS
jgi:hypothetical protein